MNKLLDILAYIIIAIVLITFCSIGLYHLYKVIDDNMNHAIRFFTMCLWAAIIFWAGIRIESKHSSPLGGPEKVSRDS